MKRNDRPAIAQKAVHRSICMLRRPEVHYWSAGSQNGNSG
jgi:hypothetical protein